MKSEPEKDKQKARGPVRFGAGIRLSYALQAGGERDGHYEKDAVCMDLSTAGVRFAGPRELAYGAMLNLRMIFREDELNTPGRVVRCSALPGGESFEIAAAFTRLGAAGEEKINSWFYAQRISEEIPDEKPVKGERRRSRRFNVSNAYAEIRKKGLFLRGRPDRGLIMQLGRHGALVSLKKRLNAGDFLELILHLPAYDELIHAAGRVVRVREAGGRYETGVEFTRVKPSDEARLSRDVYLQNLIDKSDDRIR